MRKIIHIDMDCFYAAIEMRDDPRLRDIPLAIGGSSSDRRGVIATATIRRGASGTARCQRQKHCCYVRI